MSLNKNNFEISLEDIKKAALLMKGAIHYTALESSKTFSNITGVNTHLKLENLQKTGSFKIRGAYCKINSLSEAEKKKGVIAASAGNHAQGVAYAAKLSNINSTIVMPQDAPLAKIAATKSYGAEVILEGHVYDEAYQKAQEIQKERNMTYIHAFNDPYVIAGQGTIGLEVLEQLDNLDSIIIPVGGGGLLAGVALAVKKIKPNIKIYGVQSKGAQAMYLSKKISKLVSSEITDTFADGILVESPGDLTFEIINKYVDDIQIVDDEEIARAILMLLERSKLMVEGAGAVSLAALIHNKFSLKGNVACIISGGNVDVNFISRIIERGLVRSGRRVCLPTIMPDRPGSLQTLLAIIAKLKANVLSISLDRLGRNVPLGHAFVLIRLETKDAEHTKEIFDHLRNCGYDIDTENSCK